MMQTHKLTGFQNRVYRATKKIPWGKITTYKLVAHALDSKAYRAVGSALNKNPYAPKVPCHRVIASDLTPGGFAGQTHGSELQRKLRLLAAEGVTFDRRSNKLVLSDSAMRFDFNPLDSDTASQPSAS